MMRFEVHSVEDEATFNDDGRIDGAVRTVHLFTVAGERPLAGQVDGNGDVLMRATDEPAGNLWLRNPPSGALTGVEPGDVIEVVFRRVEPTAVGENQRARLRQAIDDGIDASGETQLVTIEAGERVIDSIIEVLEARGLTP